MSSLNKYYRLYKIYLKNLNNKNYKYKPLCSSLKRFGGGRNNTGKITIRNRGGGSKRLYKKVCFDYNYIYNYNLNNWVVDRIEYDSNRSSNIALLSTNYNLDFNIFFTGLITNNKILFNTFYIYVLAGLNTKKGDLITFFDLQKQYFPFEKQWSKLKYVQTGSKIFNIELKPYNLGKIARSAGTCCKLLRKYKKKGLILLPSGKKKLISLSNYVTLGQVSNTEHNLKKNYKAGNTRWKGRRPCVRGVAKNPVDHPHGGGEGKSSGGRKSVSPWGKLTKGFVTVRKKNKKKKLKLKNV